MKSNGSMSLFSAAGQATSPQELPILPLKGCSMLLPPPTTYFRHGPAACLALNWMIPTRTDYGAQIIC